MGRYIFKLPDVGEGIAESEIAEWRVKVGDVVKEDQPLVDMLTDKASVEISSPVSGTIIELCGNAGDMAAVGGPLVILEVEGAGTPGADEVVAKRAAAAGTGIGNGESGMDGAATGAGAGFSAGAGLGAAALGTTTIPDSPFPIPALSLIHI